MLSKGLPYLENKIRVKEKIYAERGGVKWDQKEKRSEGVKWE